MPSLAETNPEKYALVSAFLSGKDQENPLAVTNARIAAVKAFLKHFQAEKVSDLSAAELETLVDTFNLKVEPGSEEDNLTLYNIPTPLVHETASVQHYYLWANRHQFPNVPMLMKDPTEESDEYDDGVILHFWDTSEVRQLARALLIAADRSDQHTRLHEKRRHETKDD